MNRAQQVILAVVVYVLGAATGGTLYALLRKSMQAPGGHVRFGDVNRLCLGRPRARVLFGPIEVSCSWPSRQTARFLARRRTDAAVFLAGDRFV